MTFSVHEIESAIAELADTAPSKFVYNYFEGQYFWEDPEHVTLLIDGKHWPVVQKDFKQAVSPTLDAEFYGTEEVWKVIKVAGQYFQKTGSYSSHYGYLWDGELEEVEPYEVTVTKYRRV